MGMKITVPSFLAKAALIQHGFDLRVSRMAGDDLISGIQDLLVCRFCTPKKHRLLGASERHMGKHNETNLNNVLTKPRLVQIMILLTENLNMIQKNMFSKRYIVFNQIFGCPRFISLQGIDKVVNLENMRTLFMLPWMHHIPSRIGPM